MILPVAKQFLLEPDIKDFFTNLDLFVQSILSSVLPFKYRSNLLSDISVRKWSSYSFFIFQAFTSQVMFERMVDEEKKKLDSLVLDFSQVKLDCDML